MENNYYMGVPVKELPKGLFERLEKEEIDAKMEFAYFLQKYLKRTSKA